MANGWGGPRSGAGRKPGSRDRFNVELVSRAEKAIEAGEMVHPFDILAEFSSDKRLDKKFRAWCADALLPYVRPKLSAIEQHNVNPWDEMSEEELIDYIQKLVSANPGILQKLNAQAQE